MDGWLVSKLPAHYHILCTSIDPACLPSLCVGPPVPKRSPRLRHPRPRAWLWLTDPMALFFPLLFFPLFVFARRIHLRMQRSSGCRSTRGPRCWRRAVATAKVTHFYVPRGCGLISCGSRVTSGLASKLVQACGLLAGSCLGCGVGCGGGCGGCADVDGGSRRSLCNLCAMEPTFSRSAALCVGASPCLLFWGVTKPCP